MTDRQMPLEKHRATHTERHGTVERLGTAFTAGRRTVAEFEERAAAAWAAGVRSDLAALTADLPSDLPPPDRADRCSSAERMLPRLRRLSSLWAVLGVISVVLWG